MESSRFIGGREFQSRGRRLKKRWPSVVDFDRKRFSLRWDEDRVLQSENWTKEWMENCWEVSGSLRQRMELFHGRHWTTCISEPRACARQGHCPMHLRPLPGELTDLQRNSQPPVPSVSQCAHFQLASLLLICTKSNLTESARCTSSPISYYFQQLQFVYGSLSTTYPEWL